MHRIEAAKCLICLLIVATAPTKWPHQRRVLERLARRVGSTLERCRKNFEAIWQSCRPHVHRAFGLLWLLAGLCLLNPHTLLAAVEIYETVMTPHLI